MNSRHL